MLEKYANSYTFICTMYRVDAGIKERIELSGRKQGTQIKNRVFFRKTATQ